jgi:arylsulfatase A-like enzyme
MKTTILSTTLCLALFAGTSCRAETPKPAASAAKRPNIIFFIGDDIYADMLNFMPEGKGKNLTPNLDRLAREGTVMRNQYCTSPVCTPSRYNCLTGKFASRAQNQIFVEKTKEEEGQTVIQWNSFIASGEKLLPKYLKEGGYHTGWVGKNHVVEVTDLKKFANYWDDPQKPENVAKLEHNYQRNCAAIRNVGFDYAEGIYFDNPHFIGLGKLAVQNMDWIAQAGVGFIDRYHKDPFFLYFATTIPHGPTEAEDSWQADPRITARGYLAKAPTVLPARETLPKRVKEAGVSGRNAELNLWMDDALGALLDRLEKYKLMDNTIIFFFNDQGMKAKGHLYQGGVYTPSLVWRSKGFNCGSESDALVENIDFAPTILDFAGIQPPKDAAFDGVSFKPVLDGKTNQVHDSLFFELGYARGVVKGNYKYIAVRYPEYAQQMSLEKRKQILDDYNGPRRIKKMNIVNTDPAAPFSHFSTVPGGEAAEHESYGVQPGYFDADQLYDLAADPKEAVNLAAKPELAAKLQELKSELKTYLNKLPGTFAELKPDAGQKPETKVHAAKN